MSASTSMIPLFINLLAAIAPSLWVIAAGALGIGIGVYGKSRLDLRKVMRTVKRKPATRKPTAVKRPRK